MKKIKLFIVFCLIHALTINIYGQVTDPNNTATAFTQFVGFDGTGTSKNLDIRNNFNEHLNLFTNSIHRIKLNPDVSYFVNGHSGNRNGYMLLGNSAGANASLFSNDTMGAYSLLHLNGEYAINGSGYRPWMKTGITFTDNSDISYMGLRTIANHITETVIAWANDGDTQYGPDDLCFRFLGVGLELPP